MINYIRLVKLRCIIIFCLAICFQSFGFKPGTPVPPDSLKPSCDTLWLKSGKTMLVTIISDKGSEIKFTDCPPSEIVSTIPKSSTKLSPRDSILAAKRAKMCDTIYVKGGEIIAGHMKFYNSRKVVYTGCCAECITEKELKRKDVDSIVYVDGRVVTSSTVTQSNPENLQIEPQQSKPVEEDIYSPQEKEEFKRKMKIFGIIGLCLLGVAVTAAILVIAITSLPPIAFGVVFFVSIVAGMFMAMGYIRNKKKAGLAKKKKRN